MAPSHETYTARRLNVEVPGVREFQRLYEQAVPANPVDAIAALVQRGVSWAEVIDAHAELAPHGFLIYWRNDVHGVMRLASNDNDCIAYLMGNVTIAEQMFRHDPRAMLYAPLRTVIWEDAHGRAWFTVDQPSTQFASFGIPAVSAIGVELDRKLAALLEALRVEVPMALLSSTRRLITREKQSHDSRERRRRASGCYSMTRITTRRRTADGLVIRYAEADEGGDETVLLLNPWPESLFAWDTIWSRLAQTARLVAIDLPGFGQSERRAELLSPRAMGMFLLRLIDEWELGRPHVVGPDVGTGAVLFAVSEDLDRFTSAVVGSGGASVPLEVTGTLKQIIEAPDVSAFRALDGREIVAGALAGIERHTLPEAVREDYLASYAGDRFVESMAYVRSYPSDLPVLAERLGDIRTPVQIIAGRHDALVPPSNAEFLHARLAHSKLDILDTGHFAWEDGADDYLELTRTWIEAHSTARSRP